MFESIEQVTQMLEQSNYIAERRLAVSVFLAGKLNKPLLVEGPAGVGKTELGKAVARATGTKLIRLQCSEGLDEAKALYEWNYQKQLLYIQSCKGETGPWEKLQQNIYSRDFLLPRPLLKAFLAPERVTLLIDELDKSDDEFESFLLEALSEFQVTIPELGTVHCRNMPFVVLTSNNRRNLTDALKRRCLHLYINYPDSAREMKIIKQKVPGINEHMVSRLVKFIQSVRSITSTGTAGLKKPPGVSESIDWAKSLLLLGAKELNRQTVEDTLNVLLKYESDVEHVKKRLTSLLTD